MHPLPSIDNLRCFAAAARTLNFRAAAREVGLTPAAFSQRIRQLEVQLDAQLFVRTTRNVRLTHAGTDLIPAASACLNNAEQCIDAVRKDARSPTEILLGTRFELGQDWLAPRLQHLDTVHPELRLQLYFGAGPDLIDKIENGEIDCAITSARIDDAKITGSILAPEHYTFVASPELIARHPIEVAEDTRDLVLFDIDQALPLFRYFRDAPGAPEHLEFAHLRYLGLLTPIKAAILEGRGVGVLPNYVMRTELAEGQLKPLFPGVEVMSDHFRLIYRDEHEHRQSLVGLADSLRADFVTLES